MRAFGDYNPIAIFIYFLSVTLVAMFCVNPVFLTLSLAGSVTLFLIRNKTNGIKSHIFFFFMFIITALINPVFYHNGVTVLFIANDNPVTLEALLYGIAASAMIISVIYWFRSFSQMMTSDRLLYLFGSVSPKTALVLSMTLRYIPLFSAQTKNISRAQKALGLYKEDNVIDNMRGGIRVFSVMTTWALENGVITADSMNARGYGIGRRTFFSLYRFGSSDAIMLALTAVLSALTAAGILSGATDFEFYPEITAAGLTPLSLLSYISYGTLAFLPTFIEAEERLKWKYLQSKI